MPRTPTDYSRTIMYKIVCNDLTIADCYVGHTTDFINRKYNHKIRCDNPNGKKYSLKIYQFIRENGGLDNWTMIEIEKYPCNDANEARARERYWYETLKATLNMYCPFRENENESKKIYRENNREKIREQDRIYRENNKDKIHEYYINNIENKKIYIENNRDKIREKQRLYDEKNKEKKNEHRRARYLKKKLENET